MDMHLSALYLRFYKYENQTIRDRNEGPLFAISLLATIQDHASWFGKDVNSHVGMTAFFWIGGVMVISVLWDFNLTHEIDILMSIVLCGVTCSGSSVIIHNFTEHNINKMAITAAIVGYFTSFVLITDVITAFLEHSEDEGQTRSIQSRTPSPPKDEEVPEANE